MNLSRCPFWNVKSIHVLAKILEISVAELQEMAADGAKNYNQFEHPDTGRWIETPKERLKKLQRRVHDLLNRLDPPSYLFSGFKKKSAVGNAKHHKGGVAIIKLDIHRFYPSTDGQKVLTFFRDDLGCANDIATILMRLCTISGSETIWRNHLPTGGVTSPVLAYFSYMRMYDSLEKLALDNDLVFSALADDMTFSGVGATPAIRTQAEKIIHSHGLRSHWKKRRCLSANFTDKVVTGVQITANGYRLPRNQKANIANLRMSLAVEKSPVRRAKLYQRLSGTVAAAAQIEDRYKAVLKRVMNSWRTDKAAWAAHLEDSGTRRS